MGLSTLRTLALRLGLGLCLALTTLATDTEIVVDLDKIPEGGRDKALESIEPGNTVKIGGKEFRISRVLGAGEKGRAFLIRIPTEGSNVLQEAVLKIPMRAGLIANRFQGFHSLSNQAAILRGYETAKAPVAKVLELAHDDAYLITEFVPGLLFDTRIESAAFGSRSTVIWEYQKLAPFLNRLRRTGIMPTDIHGGNFILSEYSNQYILFDPGSVESAELFRINPRLMSNIIHAAQDMEDPAILMFEDEVKTMLKAQGPAAPAWAKALAGQELGLSFGPLNPQWALAYVEHFDEFGTLIEGSNLQAAGTPLEGLMKRIDWLKLDPALQKTSLDRLQTVSENLKNKLRLEKTGLATDSKAYATIRGLFAHPDFADHEMLDLLADRVDPRELRRWVENFHPKAKAASLANPILAFLSQPSKTPVPQGGLAGLDGGTLKWWRAQSLHDFSGERVIPSIRELSEIDTVLTSRHASLWTETNLKSPNQVFAMIQEILEHPDFQNLSQGQREYLSGWIRKGIGNFTESSDITRMYRLLADNRTRLAGFLEPILIRERNQWSIALTNVALKSSSEAEQKIAVEGLAALSDRFGTESPFPVLQSHHENYGPRKAVIGRLKSVAGHASPSARSHAMGVLSRLLGEPLSREQCVLKRTSELLQQ